jgi:hypothetical protein
MFIPTFKLLHFIGNTIKVAKEGKDFYISSIIFTQQKI